MKLPTLRDIFSGDHPVQPIQIDVREFKREFVISRGFLDGRGRAMVQQMRLTEEEAEAIYVRLFNFLKGPSSDQT